MLSAYMYYTRWSSLCRYSCRTPSSATSRFRYLYNEMTNNAQPAKGRNSTTTTPPPKGREVQSIASKRQNRDIALFATETTALKRPEWSPYEHKLEGRREYWAWFRYRAGRASVGGNPHWPDGAEPQVASERRIATGLSTNQTALEGPPTIKQQQNNGRCQQKEGKIDPQNRGERKRSGGKGKAT